MRAEVLVGLVCLALLSGCTSHEPVSPATHPADQRLDYILHRFNGTFALRYELDGPQDPHCTGYELWYQPLNHFGINYIIYQENGWLGGDEGEPRLHAQVGSVLDTRQYSSNGIGALNQTLNFTVDIAKNVYVSYFGNLVPPEPTLAEGLHRPNSLEIHIKCPPSTPIKILGIGTESMPILFGTMNGTVTATQHIQVGSDVLVNAQVSHVFTSQLVHFRVIHFGGNGEAGLAQFQHPSETEYWPLYTFKMEEFDDGPGTWTFTIDHASLVGGNFFFAFAIGFNPPS